MSCLSCRALDWLLRGVHPAVKRSNSFPASSRCVLPEDKSVLPSVQAAEHFLRHQAASLPAVQASFTTKPTDQAAGLPAVQASFTTKPLTR